MLNLWSMYCIVSKVTFQHIYILYTVHKNLVEKIFNVNTFNDSINSITICDILTAWFYNQNPLGESIHSMIPQTWYTVPLSTWLYADVYSTQSILFFGSAFAFTAGSRFPPLTSFVQWATSMTFSQSMNAGFSNLMTSSTPYLYVNALHPSPVL